MKKFLYKTIKFIFPILLIVLVLIYIDPFKVYRNYEKYYQNNFIELNRETVCTRTYNKYRELKNFNSFIFGSSRSQAFKCEEWVKYLDDKSTLFHFDGSGEGIYGVSNKIRYIDELGDTIKNALIVVDRTLLMVNKNRDGHLWISPPELSNESNIEYYNTFLKAQVNYKFLFAYVDYSFSNKYKEYMGKLIRDSKYPEISNDTNCDIWYGYDKHIKTDSLGYYKGLIDKGVFYKRPIKKTWDSEITKLETTQLESIKAIFKKHNTNYKIVVSPVYDQIPLEEKQVELLNKIFGKENVYNFSGINELTMPISNYYEDNHYRPIVANKVLKIIYNK